jgi:hypothetical protein
MFQLNTTCVTLSPLAINGVILLITHVLFGGVAAAVTSVLTALWFAFLWYSIPLTRRLREAPDRQSAAVSSRTRTGTDSG